MNNKIKTFIKLLCLFLFFSFIIIIVASHHNEYDAIWNYSFSYAIAKGQVPYRDFAMVSTPLFAFVGAIGLRLISTDNIVFLIENALVCTALFFFLFKIYKHKTWLLLLIFLIPTFKSIIPTYNLFAILLLTIVIFLEKNNKNDLLIGLFMGFTFLTKQTVGGLLFVPTMYFLFKDKIKFFKRLIGFLIPIVIFIIYLIINGALHDFIDCCFLGLFTFGEKNTIANSFWFYLAVPMFVFEVIYGLKQKEITNWYIILCQIAIIAPIFCWYHFSLGLLLFFMLIMNKLNFNKKALQVYTIIIIMLNISLTIFHFGIYKMDFVGLNNFRFYLLENPEVMINADNFYKKHENKNPIVLATDSVYFSIINNKKLNVFSILNKGNYGYRGTEKLIDRINHMKQQYFIINMQNYQYSLNTQDQLDSEVIKEVIDNAEVIDSYEQYVLYYKE